MDNDDLIQINLMNLNREENTMKRIIDIDDEWFESIIASKDHIDKDDEAYLILNSTPYEERPQGEWNYIQAGMCVCPFLRCYAS